MKNTTLETVSIQDIFAQVAARRRAENPWTLADEARYSARSAMERARQEAWAIANPTAEDEEGEEDEA
jgi:hypothetical protein